MEIKEVVKVKIKQNIAAVYFEIIVEDGDGKLWKTEQSAFKFDFEVVENENLYEKLPKSLLDRG